MVIQTRRGASFTKSDGPREPAASNLPANSVLARTRRLIRLTGRQIRHGVENVNGLDLTLPEIHRFANENEIARRRRTGCGRNTNPDHECEHDALLLTIATMARRARFMRR